MRYIVLCVLVSGCVAPKHLNVAPAPANNIGFLYSRVQTEFAFCAYGDKVGDTINIKRIDLPEIYTATVDLVHFKPCDGVGLLGVGHSHIDDPECTFSVADVYSLLHGKGDYGFLVCGEKMVWYSKASVKRQLEEFGGK